MSDRVAPEQERRTGNAGQPEFIDGSQNLTWCRICGHDLDETPLFGQTIAHARCREYVARRVKDCAGVVERHTTERIMRWLRECEAHAETDDGMRALHGAADGVEQGWAFR